MKEDSIQVELFNRLRRMNMWPDPGKGWIRTVRTQKDMQGKELARKMHVSPARISVLEKDEQRGAVTLKMMQRAADALDCTFVYALVPKAGSQQTKPRIRLNSAHMKGEKNHQLRDLLQQYEHNLAETNDD